MTVSPTSQIPMAGQPLRSPAIVRQVSDQATMKISATVMYGMTTGRVQIIRG